MTNYTVSETTTVRTITINVCIINTVVKLQVQHGQKMTPKITFFSTQNSKNSICKNHTNEKNPWYQIVFVTSSLTQNAYNENFFERHRSNKQIGLSVVQWIVSSVKQ